MRPNRSQNPRFRVITCRAFRSQPDSDRALSRLEAAETDQLVDGGGVDVKRRFTIE